MASGHGTAVIDFGAYPGSNEATVTATGLTGISATSKVEAYVMADDTSVDHTAADHRYLAQFATFVCGTPGTNDALDLAMVRPMEIKVRPRPVYNPILPLVVRTAEDERKKKSNHALRLLLLAS